MRPNIIQSIVVCLATLALSFMMVACSGQDGASSDDSTRGVLYLNIASMKQTRAAVQSENEEMHSLRVVVLRQNGTVEHNRFYALEGAREEEDISICQRGKRGRG